MIDLPENDLPVYQKLFDTIYAKEHNREIFSIYFRKFRDDIERLQKCRFEVLDDIFSKDIVDRATLLLEWLRFNFTELQEETDELNKYYGKSNDDIWNEYMRHYHTIYNSSEDYIKSFKAERDEYERHKQIRYCKERTIKNCKKLLLDNVYKNRFISEFSKMLSFPEAYNKFEEAIPKMTEYQEIYGKNVFYRGKITKQFLKWYN